MVAYRQVKVCKQKHNGGAGEVAIMIRPCEKSEFEMIYDIINDAAKAYKGVIPDDRWHEPYMTREELQHEIEAGVLFLGFESGGELIGVMGIQDKGDVDLIRHAYVRTRARRQGVGAGLLRYLESQSDKPILIGTWADATWAVAFYQKHGYSRVTEEEKNWLLKTYWQIPDRQVETSVVLADSRWMAAQAKHRRRSWIRGINP